MSSLEAIRDAIAATVAAAIPTLKTYAVVEDSVIPPALVVQVAPPASFTEAMGRGLDTWLFDLLVIVPSAEPAVTTRQLDGYVTGAGENSVRQAVFNAKTLGLSDVDAHVSELTAYDIASTICGVPHIAATLRLVVHTSGTQ